MGHSERGSNRRRRKPAVVRRLHRKVRDARRDVSHRLSRELTAKAPVTAVEDLSIKGMIGNDMFAKAVADAAWSATLEKMAYRAEWHGRSLVKHGGVKRSTGVCSRDGTTVERPPLHQLRWTCPTGATALEPDVAAAQGVRLTAEKVPNEVERGKVEPVGNGRTTRVKSGIQRRRGRGLRRRSSACGRANGADHEPQYLGRDSRP